MSKNIEILNIIEYLRQKLHLLAKFHGLSHPQVLETSQLLDQELTKYYRLYENKNVC